MIYSYTLDTELAIRWAWLAFSTTDQSFAFWTVSIGIAPRGVLSNHGMAECTSAVSSDIEGRMYEHSKSLGITLITISLRWVSRPSHQKGTI
jgi:hypothetical protein